MYGIAPELTLEPELRLIGCVAVDGKSYERAREVRPEMLRHAQCRSFWEACETLAARGEIIDLPLIFATMRAAGTEPDIALFSAGMDATPSAAMAGTYAALVKRQHLAGKLGELGDKLSTMALLGDPAAMNAMALEELDRLNAGSGDALVSSREALVSLLAEIRDRQQGAKNFTPTGIAGLDKILGGGMLNAGLYLLAARPGMGKTTLALAIAEYAAREHGVLYVSLEMGIGQIAAKRLAAATGIPGRELLMGSSMPEDLQEKLRRAAEDMQSSGFTMNKAPAATVSDIRTMAAGVKDLRLIIVDYIGLVLPAGGSGSQYERITGVSGDLKRLAVGLNVPILALCQLSRECEKRTGHRPELSDLRDSGSLEQDADGVIMLYRDDYYSPPGRSSISRIECIVRKNRHAACGTAQLDMFLPTGKVMERPAANR